MEILALGQRVRCHKNLHRGDWSISLKGKVVAHVPEIVLANVTFKIRETARQRVIARKCREVHCWAEGEIALAYPAGLEALPITYSPYRAPTFTARATGAPVTSCQFVYFTARDGAVAMGDCK